MSNIINYNTYILNKYVKLNESVYINYNELIKSIDGKKLNLYDEFKISKIYKDIVSLYKDDDFNKDINNKKIYKTKVEFSNDYDTYLNKKQTIKFFCLSKENSTKLDIKYIIVQVKNNDKEWSDLELYEINNDIRRFYDGLTTRTIEVSSDKNNYIYITSNSGENWLLKNIEKENDVFKKTLSIEELREILKDNKYNIKFI